ncbi:MAG: ABC transporter ATP-binding protein, partial [Firmicutes bacterium]|nr:ABC transporter ATP-binding protein [Bacillota bacterium]
GIFQQNILENVDKALNLIRNGASTESAAEQFFPAITTAVIILICIYAIGLVAGFIYQRVMAIITQSFLNKMRNIMFAKMQKLPIKYFDTHTHGDIMSHYTNDIDTLRQLVSQSIPQLIISTLTLAVVLFLMLYFSVWMTLIVFVGVIAMALVTKFVGGGSAKYFVRQQKALGKAEGCIEEMIHGQKVVKVFCHEEKCEEEFGKLNQDLRDKQIKAQFFGGIMGPIMGNMSQVSYAVTACIGGIFCAMGNFDIGGLTVFVNYSRQFSFPISELSMQVTNIFSALAGAERVFAMMDVEPEAEDAEDAVDMKEMKGHVILDNVTFGYNPDKIILKNISLYAKPGQKIAFVGSTGAGKTTITNLLNRFYDIQEGSITIDGVDIKDIKRDTLRQNIAMVLQDTHLFTGTVRENIRFGRLDATDDEVIAAAKTASAHSFIMRLENGYDTMLEGDGANLSQGQRQLLNIARAAISKAPILVLDEATSSVDTRTERHIEHGMDRLMKDRTTFVIAHRLSTVRNANAIMVLEQGEIIERGDHEDLLAQKGRYYELYTGKKELD